MPRETTWFTHFTRGAARISGMPGTTITFPKVFVIQGSPHRNSEAISPASGETS